MHRKSAYILTLAVLGMLVIGIVMLFSTSAFAKDSRGDVYFFIRRRLSGSASGWWSARLRR
jgi:cell division protein FtsW